MESWKWKVESGKWKVESEKWKVESWKWKVESEGRADRLHERKTSLPEGIYIWNFRGSTWVLPLLGEGGTPLGVTEEVNKRNIVFICSPADSYLSTSSVSLRLTAPPHRGSTPKFVLNHTSAPPYMKVLPERTFPKADKNSVGNRFYFHNRPFFTSFNFQLSTFNFQLPTYQTLLLTLNTSS